MATPTSRTARPTLPGLLLGWVLIFLAAVTIAGTVAELARLPALLQPEGAPAVARAHLD